MKAPLINGERIKLIPFTEKMVSKNYIDWLNDPQINLFLEVRHSRVTIEKQRKIVKDYIESPNVFYWAIALKAGDTIGSVKLMTDKYGVGEIGILIGDSRYWNLGFATEAIHTLSNWVISQKAARKLSAGAYSRNEGSIKAFIKNGFEIEGLRKDHVIDESFGVSDIILLGKILGEPEGRMNVKDFNRAAQPLL